MKSFTNIKRYLGTTAAVLTLASSAAVQADSFEYNFVGTVVTNPTAGGLFTVDIGGQLGGFFIADAALSGSATVMDSVPGLPSAEPDGDDFDEALGFCPSPCTPGWAADAANRTSVRYVLRNLNQSFALPGIRQGSVTASTLTTDSYGNITGGSVSLNTTAIPTLDVTDLTLDVDAGTWELTGGAGTIVLATGTLEGFVPVGGENVPVMPPLMMVVGALGLLLVGGRHLKTRVTS